MKLKWQGESVGFILQGEEWAELLAWNLTTYKRGGKTAKWLSNLVLTYGGTKVSLKNRLVSGLLIDSEIP